VNYETTMGDMSKCYVESVKLEVSGTSEVSRISLTPPEEWPKSSEEKT
jgi:hypothetical protein